MSNTGIREAGGEQGLRAPARPGGEVVGVVGQVLGRTGIYGECTQVLVSYQGEGGRWQAVRRNIKGPVRLGDPVLLRDVEREAKPLRQGRGKG